MLNNPAKIKMYSWICLLNNSPQKECDMLVGQTELNPRALCMTIGCGNELVEDNPAATKKDYKNGAGFISLQENGKNTELCH